MHISVDIQRITLNASCMTISGGRTKQLVIIAGFLPRHWLYKWFSQFRSCGTYSVLSRSPSILLLNNFLIADHRKTNTLTSPVNLWGTQCNIMNDLSYDQLSCSTLNWLKPSRVSVLIITWWLWFVIAGHQLGPSCRLPASIHRSHGREMLQSLKTTRWWWW